MAACKLSSFIYITFKMFVVTLEANSSSRVGLFILNEGNLNKDLKL